MASNIIGRTREVLPQIMNMNVQLSLIMQCVSPEFGRWFLPKMSLYVYHRVQIKPLVTGLKLFNMKVIFSQIDRSFLQVRSKRNQIDLDGFFFF